MHTLECAIGSIEPVLNNGRVQNTALRLENCGADLGAQLHGNPGGAGCPDDAIVGGLPLTGPVAYGLAQAQHALH